MGNHVMGHDQTWVNSASPKVLEMTIAEVWKQLAKIVTQSLYVVILIIGVETIVAPNTNVVRGGVLIGFVANLGCGSSKVSMGRNLNRNLGIPTTNIGVIGTPHMVFTNHIMTIHVNTTTNWPLMSSIIAEGYKNTNVENPKGGYQEPYISIARILDHRNGHTMRPKMVAFKYLNFF